MLCDELIFVPSLQALSQLHEHCDVLASHWLLEDPAFSGLCSVHNRVWYNTTRCQLPPAHVLVALLELQMTHSIRDATLSSHTMCLTLAAGTGWDVAALSDAAPDYQGGLIRNRLH